MKKNNLISKVAIAVLALGGFGVVSNITAQNRTYAVQNTFTSANWNLNEAELRNLKEQAYLNRYDTFPNQTILDKIYVKEDDAHNLKFYVIKPGSNGNVFDGYNFFNILFRDREVQGRLFWGFSRDRMTEVKSRLAFNTYPTQSEYNSANWHLNEKDLNYFKKEAYLNFYGHDKMAPTQEILDNIYVAEDGDTKNLEFFYLKPDGDPNVFVESNLINILSKDPDKKGKLNFYFDELV